MTVIVNQSLFPAQGFEHRFFHGNRYHCLSSKVTLVWDAQGRLTPLARQPALQLHDHWRDEPERSSLVYPSDLSPFKPTTDVLVTGTVRPPQERPMAAWAAELRLPGRQKRLRFFGPRQWRHSVLGGWTLSAPEPTEGVALLYENAYGGTLGPAREHYAEGEFYPPNPVGCGFVGTTRAESTQPQRAAQIEAWDAPLLDFGRDVAPGGFGPLPAHVPERLRHAGTYDAQWREQVAPHIPLDMDLRYWNSAQADQQPATYLKAGDVIELLGVRPGPALRWVMPAIEPTSVSQASDGTRNPRGMNLDTVVIDLDSETLTLRYHDIRPVEAQVERINLYCAIITSPAGS